MAFSLVNYSPCGSSSTDEASIIRPVNSRYLDVSLVILARTGDTSLPSVVPSGFERIEYETSVGGSLDLIALYAKVHKPGEPANWTWGWASSYATGGLCMTYRDGFNTRTPVDDSSSEVYAVPNLIKGAGVTASNDNSPLIFLGCKYSAFATTITAPFGFSNSVTVGDIGNCNFYLHASSKLMSFGYSGDHYADVSTGGDSKHGFLVALDSTVVPVNSAPLLGGGF